MWSLKAGRRLLLEGGARAVAVCAHTHLGWPQNEFEVAEARDKTLERILRENKVLGPTVRVRTWC